MHTQIKLVPGTWQYYSIKGKTKGVGGEKEKKREGDRIRFKSIWIDFPHSGQLVNQSWPSSASDWPLLVARPRPEQVMATHSYRTPLPLACLGSVGLLPDPESDLPAVILLSTNEIDTSLSKPLNVMTSHWEVYQWFPRKNKLHEDHAYLAEAANNNKNTAFTSVLLPNLYEKTLIDKT